MPSRTPDLNRKEIELTGLKRQLEQAVRNEDYETAAKLRDRIQSYS
jgi:protein-arginine kinase activator protein McsA